MSKDDVAWAYVSVHISVERNVGEDVIDALTKWFGSNYSLTQRSARATDRIVEREGDMTFLTFSINKRYNPHEAAKKAAKKLNELLAAET